jgi:hypothetical protein
MISLAKTYIYKLNDIRFLKNEFEYKIQLLGFTNECYLSPELFRELGKKTHNPLYNYDKSEVISKLYISPSLINLSTRYFH